jgi:hypothetical protein
MLLAYLFGGIFFLCGTHMLRRNEKSRGQARQALGWPVVRGRVVESRIAYAQKGKDEDDTLSFWYAYEVDGVRHVEKSVGVFGLETLGSLPEMEAIVKKYPHGTTVAVHYDPAHPARAVIEPGNRTAYLTTRWFGSLLLLIGAGTLAALFFH